MTRETLYVAMTRGKQSNIAYVATDQDELEAHQREDEPITAATVLAGVLGHEGAEMSARETIAAEQNTWGGIEHLANQYETIAQAAQAEHTANLLTATGLDAELVERITGSEDYGALVAEVRRVHAHGHQVSAVLGRAVRAGGLEEAGDPAADVRRRITRLTAGRSRGTRATSEARFIAGLIPAADGPMPYDMRQALQETAALIERRADSLARTAVAAGEAWATKLPIQPPDEKAARSWWAAVSTIAAYRDRYHLITDTPLGPDPDSVIQRLDQQRAASRLNSISRAAPMPQQREALARDFIER